MTRCSALHFTIWARSMLGTMVLCAAQIPTYLSCQAPAIAQQGAGEYRIAGTVVSKSDGHPLDQAVVELADVKNRKNVQTLITTQDGKFQFQGMAAGKYGLTGHRIGYIDAGY